MEGMGREGGNGRAEQMWELKKKGKSKDEKEREKEKERQKKMKREGKVRNVKGIRNGGRDGKRRDGDGIEEKGKKIGIKGKGGKKG